MPWFVVYSIADGTPVSAGSSVADSLPAGLAFKQFAQDPTLAQRWDPATLTYVVNNAPAPARQALIDRIMAQGGVAAMNNANKTAIRNAVLAVMPEAADI